ncbi:hypothetical protein SD70_23805 [Gordoniibacillus kamchatkensis]|uniref:Gluconate 2-dehydrogenase subunit 3 family protein n=1 Tax=Gordoniibacillus kamchatkensis TaxID=1590651 RepID=A0ABR5ADZ6_9BACL|nr:gluconate 2-dehydrogenase subunit 3 family protein [Paenibacillus sp. VKM B-2647]KIL38815.1 hypothetical protein SD70_23805 [Paenibacillus sp. VKM B-2647]
MKNSKYPTYDVMEQQEHWDEHTRSIVSSRLVREHGYRFLTTVEAETLRAWCPLLVDDTRADIIQYVLCHIDETLEKNKGESQRKPGVPPERELLRSGLKAMEQAALSAHGRNFFHLDEETRRKLLTELSQADAEPSSVWNGVPQKELFGKVLALTVESYYSHPTVWSEIGYGGPAYPRGYVRTNIGQLDPWEAKAEP